MPEFYGDDAIAYLSRVSFENDPNSSSHWDFFHRNFKYSNNEFFGIDGFGSNEEKYKGIRSLAHKVLQYPFYLIGSKYSSFVEVNKVAHQMLDIVNKGFSLDVLRQVITLSFLIDRGAAKEKNLSCVIGDGYAIMSSLLHASLKSRVVIVNLSKTLLVDLWQLKKYLKDSFKKEVVLVNDEVSILKILSSTQNIPSFIAIEAKNHEILRKMPINLYINIASMQEMNPKNINEYFEDIKISTEKKGGYFYCCNREKKILPDGTIVRFDNYPWEENQEYLTDEICPWHKKFYNLKFPFYHKYDGLHIHRLVKY